jgi:hypothetical protein
MINLDKFFGNSGQFISATFKSEKKPAAIHKNTLLEKRIEGVFRAGIDFGNLGSVKDAIANGERGEVQPLPFGEWLKFPYLIQYKETQYVRLYPTKNCVLKVQYLVNGVESTKDNFLSFLTPSDKAKAENGEKPECITVKVSNLIKLG